MALDLEAGALAGELAQPLTSAYALHVGCLLRQIRGERALVEERSAALVALAAEQGFPHFVGTGTFFRGWAMAAGGAVEEGIAEMRRGLAAKRATGAEIKVPYDLGLLAAAEVAAGRPIQALQLLAEAVDKVESTKERWFEAELWRLWGETLLRADTRDPTRAEECFRRALDVAAAQGARWWELRATASVARLHAERGGWGQARDLLEPMFGWFTESFGTPDLGEARTLLDALA